MHSHAHTRTPFRLLFLSLSVFLSAWLYVERCECVSMFLLLLCFFSVLSVLPDHFQQFFNSHPFYEFESDVMFEAVH